MGLMTLQQFANIYDASVSKVFSRQFGAVTDMAAKVMKRQKIDASEDFVKSRQYVGLGEWNQTDDGKPVKADHLAEGFGVTITPAEYKNMVVVTQRMVEVDAKRDMLRDTAQMGKGAGMSQQKLAASVFNNAFTVASGGDSTYLCSDSHPYPVGSPMYGSTQDNKSTSALADATLKAGRLALMNQLDDRGFKFLDPTAKLILLVPPALTDTAKILIESRGASGTADNDMNVHAGRYEIVEWNLLTSDTAWFLIHPDHYLVFYDRVMANISAPIVEPKVGTVSWVGRASFAAGYEDWRGVYGSTGA